MNIFKYAHHIVVIYTLKNGDFAFHIVGKGQASGLASDDAHRYNSSRRCRRDKQIWDL